MSHCMDCGMTGHIHASNCATHERDPWTEGEERMTTPLTRPSTRRCPSCQCRRPIGQFSEHIQLDKDPQRPRRIDYEVCRGCRSGSTALPGRAFQ